MQDIALTLKMQTKIPIKIFFVDPAYLYRKLVYGIGKEILILEE